jgi:hypothetical protein
MLSLDIFHRHFRLRDLVALPGGREPAVLQHGARRSSIRHAESVTAPMPILQTDGQKVLLAVKAMRGAHSDAWRSVLDDLIGRGLCRPDLPDREPAARPCLTFAVQNPAVSGRLRCTVPLRDKDVFDTHVLACAAPAPPKRAVPGQIEERWGRETGYRPP